MTHDFIDMYRDRLGVESICKVLPIAPSALLVLCGNHALASPTLLRLRPARRNADPAQYVSIRYAERLAEAGIESSVGSKGDSDDNALAELIRRRAPWKTR